MPQSQSGITYFVRNADGKTGYGETWRPGANQSRAVLQCAYEDWPALSLDLLGTCKWTGGRLERTLPMFHPKWNWMICVDAELVEVIGTPKDQGDIGEFDPDSNPLAVVAATFQSVLYDVLSDGEAASSAVGELSRYVLRQSRYGLELLELKGTWQEFTDLAVSGVPAMQKRAVIGANPTRPYPNTPLVYTWLRVPAVSSNAMPNYFPLALWENITGAVGKLNRNTFDGVYEPGTLLCGIPEIEQQVGPTGDIEFQIKYNFTFHSPKDVKDGTDSWNVKYRTFNNLGVTDPGLYPVDIADSGGDTPFRYADFDALFKNG